MKTPISLALLFTGAVTALLPYPAARAQLASARYTITTIADTTNPQFTDFSQAYPAINNNGVVVFRATLADGSQALYSSVNGALIPLVSTTDTTGLFTGFVDNTIGINTTGTIVFAGTTTVDGVNTPAIFAVNQGGGTPVPIVTGASDPVDLGDALKDPAINDANLIVFEAEGTENPNLGTHVGGYFEAGSGGGSTPAAIYTSENINVSLFPPVISSDGQVAFIIDPGVPLFSGDTDAGQQVWRVDAPGAAPQVLAATGSNNVSSFVNFAKASPIDVLDIDATGKVVYNATLTDGTEAIYLSTGPGDVEPFLATGSSGFSQLGNAAFGKSDALVFYGLSSTVGGAFDGIDPNNDYVVYTASGYTITAFSGAAHGQINAGGQFVFYYSATRNADGSSVSGIAVATPNAGGGGTPPPTPTPPPTGTPVVTIGPATGKTYENGGAIKLAVSRTGDTSAALTVAYTVKGSAKAGSNFKKLPGTVVIPAGSDYVFLKIKIKDDHIADGTKVLKVTLLPGDGYTVGTAALSKIKILNAD